MSITVRIATLDDAPIIAPLFNAYRMFYGQRSDLDAASSFITERLRNNQSVIFMALYKTGVIGFTQLYPVFSSVSMKNAWLLNDLYVVETKRGMGAATALLEAAKEHGRQTGSAWVMLQTAANNHPAQMAYKSNGWVKDEEYYVYTINLTK
ncbi:MAG TPA: GNAT family N-acetyltransferase [Chitinophagaceae bacterium]|nr:GNAT family N-acetyltransferase [Chitinophagaceae bacterium]